MKNLTSEEIVETRYKKFRNIGEVWRYENVIRK